MKHDNDTLINDLMLFLDSSPVNFFAVKTAAERLDSQGFTRLDPAKHWEIKPGGRYYITKNHSAIFAFIAGTGGPDSGFRIITSHSDSPGFRIKPHAEMISSGAVKLNTEVYGGPLLHTWFDRPLSIAGRVMLRTDDPMRPATRLVKWEQPLLTIPHLAIHFDRAINENGHPLSRQKDMLPVLGLISGTMEKDNIITGMICDQLGVKASEILDFDLSLYDITPAMRSGLNREFINSGRIDDLSMAHASLTALLSEATKPHSMTRIAAIFDNEETGSGTKQGACSPTFHNLLRRITSCIGGTEEDFFRAIENSFLVSADNAHAIHPNYPEKQDPTNHPVLGGGPVIKINANCKYMTDADSAAVFAEICRRADVPVQYFVNHSDMAGGSTLGNLLTSQIDFRGVDMGAPMWAMHSIRETASTADHIYIVNAFEEFFS